MFPLAALALAALLLLNEVLIRPAPGGSEWIEIYNAGNDPVPLAGLTLEDARRRPSKLPATTAPLEPQGYRLIAANAAKVIGASPGLDPARVLSLDGAWPTLNDSDGASGFADLVLLRGADGTPLDSLVYYERWLGSPGVSLERVDVGAPASLPSNWSPSVDESLATPLRLNSLSLTPVERDQGALLVPGGPAFAGGDSRPPIIAWHLEQPASIAIELFDLAGRTVRLLKPLEPGATVGRLVWDGTDDRGHPVPAGVYLVLLEGHYDGETATRRWRKPLVVARSGR